MSCFIDTSAFYALLDADDCNHVAAEREWDALLQRNEALVVTNYILVETFALTQHRLGIEAVRVVQNDVMPLLTVEWVRDEVHAAGMSAVLGAQRRDLSLVDCVSFETMRRLGIRDVFTFDGHFAEQRFHALPTQSK